MRLLALALVGAMAVPAAAEAAGTPVPIIPPGNPGANQYSETVPTAAGGGSGIALRSRATQGGRGAAMVLPSRTRAQLAHLGADGRRAAALAEATAPTVLGAGSLAVTAGRTAPSPMPRAATGPQPRAVTGAHAPAVRRPDRSPPPAARGGRGGRASTPSGAAPLTSIARAAFGGASGGVEPWLPVALLVSAVVILALAVRSRRAR